MILLPNTPGLSAALAYNSKIMAEGGCDNVRSTALRSALIRFASVRFARDVWYVLQMGRFRSVTLLVVLTAAFAASANPASAGVRDGTTRFNCQLIYLGGGAHIFYHNGHTCAWARSKAVWVFRHRRSPAGYRCRFSSRYPEVACKSRYGRAQFGWYIE